MRLRMSKKPAPIPSEALLAQWRSDVVAQECGDLQGGCLGERVARSKDRAQRIRFVELLLLERSWAEPAVER